MSLLIGNPPTLEYVFLAVDSIGVNLARKKLAMLIIGKIPKFAKAIEPAYFGEKNISNTQSKTLREKFCLGCGVSTHPAAKCWILHRELKPANVRKNKEDVSVDQGGYGQGKIIKATNKPLANKS